MVNYLPYDKIKSLESSLSSTSTSIKKSGEESDGTPTTALN